MKPQLDIVIYRISGRQLFFKVPDKWCEECDLTINLVKRVLVELGLQNDPRVRVTVKPWINNIMGALSFGGWHAPVLLINEQVYSQGVVPNRAKLTSLIRRRLNLPAVPAGETVSP